MKEIKTGLKKREFSFSHHPASTILALCCAAPVYTPSLFMLAGLKATNVTGPKEDSPFPRDLCAVFKHVYVTLCI